MPIDYELLKLCIEQDFDPNEKRQQISQPLKEKILERDEGCRICGHKLFVRGASENIQPSKTRIMRVHHIKPKGDSSEENLITVCLPCHEFIHQMQSRRVKGFHFHY